MKIEITPENALVKLNELDVMVIGTQADYQKTVDSQNLLRTIEEEMTAELNRRIAPAKEKIALEKKDFEPVQERINYLKKAFSDELFAESEAIWRSRKRREALFFFACERLSQ